MDRPTSDLRFGRFRLEPAQRQLLVDGQPAALGARAFDLLLALVERRDRVVGKAELLDLVWPGLVVEENNLQVQISTLRKLLGPNAIATIPGRGYRFTAALEVPAAGTVARKSSPGTQSPPSNLPLHLPPIIGRDAEARELFELLAQHALVTVAGPGGIGKTRLALAVAEAGRSAFPDGVWWVELAATSDPALVAGTAAQTLGISVSADRPAAATTVSVLKSHKALLVLDNCEQVLDAVADLVATLLRHCPDVKVLVTSQEPLKLPDEQVLRLGSLAVPSGDEMAQADVGAIALFIARAKAAEPRLRLDPASVPTIASICRALDGMPLAIELAAARVPLLGIDGLHQRLDERFRLLTGGARLVLPRHQTLRAALEWSHGLLGADEKIVFRRLGVFSGGFALELAQGVAADERIDRWAVLDLLGHLVDKSLVVANADVDPRYGLLESTRAFALEQLVAADESGAVLRRHAQAVYEYLAPLHARYWTLDPEDSERGPAELDNLRAALDWADSPAGDRSLGYALLGVSQLVWHRSGQLLEGLERCRRLLPVPTDLPAEVEARFRLLHARLGYLTGRPDSFEAAGRAAQLFRELDDRSGLADALIARAMIGSRRGDRALVDAAIAEAEAVLVASAPAQQRATLALAQALWHLMHDRRQQAVEAALRQEACYREVADDRGVQIASANAGHYMSIAGEFGSALTRLRRALPELRRMQAPHGVGVAFGYLSFALMLRNEPGDFEQALMHCRQALPYLRRQQRGEWLLLAMALAHARHGALDKAALLIGYSDAHLQVEGATLFPYLSAMRAEALDHIIAAIGQARTDDLTARGAHLDDDRAYSLLFEPQ